MKTLVALFVLFSVTSCAKSPQLSGSWTGADWGTVILDGLSGTYPGTYGDVPGQIHLIAQKDGTYSGKWAEGTLRFGTLELKFKKADTLTGCWKADPKCEKKAEEGGLIRWTRIK